MSNDEALYGVPAGMGDPGGFSQPSPHLFRGTDFTQLLKEYIEDSRIPVKTVKILEKFWAVLGKDVKLAFLDPSDLPTMMLYWEQAVLIFLMGENSDLKDCDYRSHLNQLRMYYIFAIKRAIGNKNGLNERIIQASQFHHSISSHTENARSGGGRGVIRKLAGFF